MITQFGVLGHRRNQAGHLEILLITSRDTRRWVVPRGNPIAGLSPEQIALQEAYEEAGIVGEVVGGEIGTYRYDKRRRDGSLVAAEVHLFAMAVTHVESDWPEAAERERRWFSPEAAASAVDEPALKRLILDFADA